MIDVFVVAILTALVQLGFLASINPGTAAVFFALSVAFTMLSAQALDPRLIWDTAEPETPSACLRPTRRPRRSRPREAEGSRDASPRSGWCRCSRCCWRSASPGTPTRRRGPTIEIVFDNAAGVIAGQTTMRFRDVAVGVVERLRLSPRPHAR